MSEPDWLQDTGATSDPRADGAPAFRIDHLSFSYPDATSPVICDLSLELPQGAFCLLVGDTGSGKSTFLSLLKPQISPVGDKRGAIECLGRPLEDMDDAQSARTVGFVFQNPDNQIVCESVWHEMAFGLENLGTPQGEMRRLIAETSYFFGIDDWFRRQTATLSGGKKQLLALASTLVMQPRILLLDEPTAQLDPIAEKNFLHALFRVNRELGCTVMVATHEPRTMVDYATCAYRMVGGKLVRVEDMDELRQRPLLLDQPPQVSRGDALASGEPVTPAVRVGGAWHRYGRDEGWVLRGLNLDIAYGGIHALVGGNGCGKSTLLGIMAGALKLRRGTVRCGDGARVLLPQDPHALFTQETVAGELAEWGPRTGYGEAEARAMAERLGISGVLGLHPYDLSGGQQQLLALGKLLLIRPRIMLLDEPTKGLDLASRRIVARLLRGVAGSGAAVVIATHDLDFVQQVADRVSMVFDGEIACTDTSEGFFRGNVYYRP